VFYPNQSPPFSNSQKQAVAWAACFSKPEKPAKAGQVKPASPYSFTDY